MALKDKREEFFENIWDHAKDPFQAQFDIKIPLNTEELEAISTIHKSILESDNDLVVSKVIKRLLSKYNFDLMALLLQLAGLTRSKIITDLKASEYSGTIPSNYRTLHTAKSWEVSGIYLSRCLRRVFEKLSTQHREAYQALNQATHPGFIRQERAKRQGHQAEYRLAVLFESLNIPFEPKEKSTNPLSKDATIHGVSFDIVVPNVASPLVVVKSTVHTANIGQYGESKDHLEMYEAQKMLDSKYVGENRPTLLALIDGIGFKSNSAGLNGVLTCSDEFCQFSTIWKAVVIAAARINKTVALSADKDYLQKFRPFLSRYKNNIIFKRNLKPGIEAGKVLVFLK
jgi:hypothetical protein